MNYNDLRDQAYHYAENRKEFKGMRIEEEDMKTLDNLRDKVFTRPFIIGGGLFGLKMALKYRPLPDFLDNPLQSEESRLFRKKIYNKFVGSQMVFIGCLTSFMYYYIRYEFGKHYMFLKYEEYVNKYVGAKQELALKTLVPYIDDKDSAQVQRFSQQQQQQQQQSSL